MARTKGKTQKQQEPQVGTATGLRVIPVNAISPGQNPRGPFDDASLTDLAENIKDNGLIQPVTVREEGGGVYSILAGRRRWKAHLLAGIEDIQVVIRESVDDAGAMVLALAENLQREDLNALDAAEAYYTLWKTYGLSHAEIGRRVGKSQPTITNALRVLTLPDDVKAMLKQRRINASIAERLAAYASNPKLCAAMANEAAEGRLTVSMLERGPNDGFSAWHYQQNDLLMEVPRDFPKDRLTGIATIGSYVIDVDAFKVKLEEYRKEQREALQRTVEQQRVERTEAAQAVEAARIEAAEAPSVETIEDAGQLAAPLEDAPAVIDLNALSYRSYEDLSYKPIPVGCTEDCPCRAHAVDRVGRQVEICTDPKRFESLSRRQTRAQNKDVREVLKEKREKLLAKLDASAVDSRMLAVAVATFLGNGQAGEREATEAAWTRHGQGQAPVFSPAAEETLTELATLPVESLVRLLVEKAMLSPLEWAIREKAEKVAGVDWYLGLGKRSRKPKSNGHEVAPEMELALQAEREIDESIEASVVHGHEGHYIEAGWCHHCDAPVEMEEEVSA